MDSYTFMLPEINKSAVAHKKKRRLNFSIEETGFSGNIDLVEYYVIVYYPPDTQTDHFVYKTMDGNWFESIFSPERGELDINKQIKEAIDLYELANTDAFVIFDKL
jgi:hypothetical protein